MYDLTEVVQNSVMGGPKGRGNLFNIFIYITSVIQLLITTKYFLKIEILIINIQLKIKHSIKIISI